MSDLDLIKGFRAGVKEPDPERVGAAWVNVLEGLEGEARVPSRQVIRGRRRWAIPSSLAAAAVALAIALPAILPAGGPGGARSAEAARVLRRLASVAANQPAQPAPAAGQYVYTKSESFQRFLYVVGNGRPNFSFVQSATREAWIGPDGTGRLLETSGEVMFPSPRDREAWVAAGSPDLFGGETSDESFGPGELHFLDLSTLPTDPEQLLAVIEEREIVGGPDGDWETFVIAGDLLRETYAPPDLRAALYEVAANLPGVEFVGKVMDALGRPGIGVAYTTPQGVRQELIFDPDTAQLLGESEVMVNPEETGLEIGPDIYPGTIYGGWGEPGTVVYSAVYLVSGVVDSTEARP